MTPPKILELTLKWIVDNRERESLVGDFAEIYKYKTEESNAFAASTWYLTQICKLIPAIFFESIFWSIIMFSNYFRTAYRYLLRHKTFSVINLTGLSIGIASTILILIWVFDEINYDTFHEDYDKIYRLNWDFKWKDREGIGSGTPPPLAKTLSNEIPGISETVRIHPLGDMITRYEDIYFNEDKIISADSNFFNFFSFKLLEGNPNQVLKNPNSVVLSQSAAIKYFGDVSPIGKLIKIGEDKIETRSEYSYKKNYHSLHKVTGIVEDHPKNSHIEFDMIASINSIPAVEFFDWSWIWMQVVTYAKVDNEELLPLIEETLKKLVAEKAPAAFDRVGFSYSDLINNNGKWDFPFQPINDIYLGSFEIGNRLGSLGNKNYIYILTSIALFILILACVNFMNLTTSKSLSRSKEIGVRKVLGSDRGKLIKQFLAESIFFSFVSTIIALAIVFLVFQYFENLSGKEFSFNSIMTVENILLLFGFVLTVGILAGSYPAMFLSSLKPTHVLKGGDSLKISNLSFRNILVVFQFSVSTFLIISTLIINEQIEFFTNKDLGFNKENILVVDNRNNKLGEKYESFRSSLINNPGIENVSISTGVPSLSWWQDYYKVEGKNDEQFELASYHVDENLIHTFNFEIVEGRGFEKEFSTNSSSVILNETAVKNYGWDDPIGKTIEYPGGGLFEVIGVVKDFNHASLYQEMFAFGLFHISSAFSYNPNSFVVVKLKGENINESISFIENKWEEFVPDKPFEFGFIDETIQQQYTAETKLSKLFLIFSSLAILIAGLGLLGLAAFTAEKRNKEVGIRKTLGASVPSLQILLQKDFIKLILISNLIAWPTAFYFMNKWLSDFAYKIEIGFIPFLISALSILIFSTVVVGLQLLKTVRRNPIDVIRYE